jgi:hypothetical protein
MTPVITSAIGGQPGTLMMGLSVMTLSIGVAWVGLGLAACTQPQEAQEPQAMTALASLATCFSCSMKGLPPMDAVHAVLVQRRVALHGQDVVALVLLHDLFERLGLVAGGGHQVSS